MTETAGCTKHLAVQSRPKRVVMEKPWRPLAKLCGSAPLWAVIIAASWLKSALGQDGTWVAKAPMPTERWGLAAAVVEGKLYVVGGAAGPAGISLSDVEAYDPRTDTWITKDPIPTPRLWAGAAVANGILYVAGGQLQDAFGVTILNTFEAYDRRTNTWTTKAPMPTPRYGMAMGVIDGVIYVVGGVIAGNGITGIVEAYDPSTDTWTTRPPMPTPREFLAVAVAGGRLYALGGAGVGGPINPLGTVEAYDAGTNNWTILPSMPTPRTGLGAGYIGGLIFAVGGQGDSRSGIYFPTVEVLDRGSNTWASAPRMSEGRAMLGVGVADDVLYAVGGIGEMRRIFSANEAFSPVAISLSSTSLTFASQVVGTTSAEQVVTLTNTGTATLAISSIAVAGDFAQTNNCGSSVNAGASCTINVTFTPTTRGTRTGTLSIIDNASDSPQTVSLSGTGVAPVVSLSPTSLAFGDQGKTGPAKSVTLSNTGDAPLTISSVAISQNFAQTNDCGSSVAAGASCTFNVTFQPTAPGPVTGQLAIADNAAGSPHTVSLSGMGILPAVSLTRAELDLGSTLVGTTGDAQTVMLSNSGNATLNITNITPSGDFAQTNNCGSSATAGANCTINVTFTPAAAGSRAGTLTITDNATGSPHTVALSGIGTDFSLAAGAGFSTTATVTAGQTATYTLSIAPLGGLKGSVNLACSGAPRPSACLVLPTSVTLDGSNPATVNVLVFTALRSMVGPETQLPPQAMGRHTGLPLLLFFLLLASSILAQAMRQGRRQLAWPVVGACILGVMVYVACGGGGHAPVGTPAGTYSLKVVATVSAGSNNVNRSIILTLTVN